MTFTFKLERLDGTPANPRRSRVPSWTGDRATRSRLAGGARLGVGLAPSLDLLTGDRVAHFA
jgi:hypothetical protein